MATGIFKRLLFIFCWVMPASFLLPPKKKIRVYLIGDSTMCTYEPARAPLTGWGMPFTVFFDSTVIVSNHARGGRSTRTFLSENRWSLVRDSLQPGDYVLMQFGHNDEAKEERYRDRYTPVPDYKSNLLKFILDTRAKGGIPVLITPVTRRRFDTSGRIMETHTAYTHAVYELAKEHHVPLVDLDKKSRELLQAFGPEHSKLLYMELAPGEHPNYPDGSRDNTHFTEFGARLMAQQVLSEIRSLDLELEERIVKRAPK